MFSGIVEAKAKLLEYTPDLPETPRVIQITIEKPKDFNDISIGDSIAVNGICLTVEAVTDSTLKFSLGAETIKITGMSEVEFRAQPLNLERSLRFNDRIHGHIVTGHVDGIGQITAIADVGPSRTFEIKVPEVFLPLIWQKGSICLNGVSLTVNAINDNIVEVCLIPETLKRTNLVDLKAGARVTVEVDQMARGLSRMLKFERQNRELNT